jgi:hypothetical protein
MSFRRFQGPSWSPVELDFLKQHRKDMPREQLSIALLKSYNAIKNKLDEIDGKILPTNKRVIKQGRRADLGKFMRSGWEANCARLFDYLKIEWVYEPRVFVFEKIKSGTLSYLPDFYLPGLDLWIEVKGQMIPTARTAIKRFKQFFPGEFAKLQAITGSSNTAASKFFQSKSIAVPIRAYYNELNRQYKDVVPFWE